MPLRAHVARRAGWTRVVRHHWDGTYLQCEQDVLGSWIVTDTRRPHRRLAGPFSRLNQAKVGAERVLADKPTRYRVQLDPPPEVE